MASYLDLLDPFIQALNPVGQAQAGVPTLPLTNPQPLGPGGNVRPPGVTLAPPQIPLPPVPPQMPTYDYGGANPQAGPMIRPGSILDQARTFLGGLGDSIPRVQNNLNRGIGAPPTGAPTAPQVSPTPQAPQAPPSWFSPEMIAADFAKRGIPPPTESGAPQTGPLAARQGVERQLGEAILGTQDQTPKSPLSGVKAPPAPPPLRVGTPPPYHPSGRIAPVDFARLLASGSLGGGRVGLPDTLAQAIPGSLGRRRT